MIGYFDNAATTYKKPDGMYNYMTQYMQENGANIGRGAYQSAAIGGNHLIALRRKILSLVSAPETKSVVIMPSATVSLNTIIFGLDLGENDVVYISHFEHNAILRPLYALQKQKHIQIKFFEMKTDNKFEFDLQKIEQDFSSQKPSAVFISQVSNVFGSIAPVDKIAEIAKRYGATVTVDAAQSCGVLDCNLHNIDYYVFAGHKTLLGPCGIGGFVCNRNASLRPFILGGTGVDSANMEMPKTIPERFEAGSIDLMAVVGLEYSVDWIIDNKESLRKKERENLKKLYETLVNYNYLRVITPYPSASGIISCRIDGYTSDEFGNILAERGISVRSGLHCAPEAHRYMQTFPDGVVRFSVSCFTNDKDFELLNDVLCNLEVDL